MELPWFLSPKKSGASRPRHHERVNAVGLSCHLGDVLDMSAGGMRVGREGRPSVERGAVAQVALRTSTQRVQVSARVVWVRRTSWKRWEVGLQFIGVPPAAAAVLVDLARFGYVAPKAAGGSPTPPPEPERVKASVIEVEDLYLAFGLTRAATHEQIHQAYRRLARELHPDVNKSPDAAARFTHLNKAYSILKDPEKRGRYDTLLNGCAAAKSQAA